MRFDNLTNAMKGAVNVASWAGHGWTDLAHTLGAVKRYDTGEDWMATARRGAEALADMIYIAKLTPKQAQGAIAGLYIKVVDHGPLGPGIPAPEFFYYKGEVRPRVEIGVHGQGVWTPTAVQVTGPDGRLLRLEIETTAYTRFTIAEAVNPQPRDFARALAIWVAAVGADDIKPDKHVRWFAERCCPDMLSNPEFEAYAKNAHYSGHVFAGLEREC